MKLENKILIVALFSFLAVLLMTSLTSINQDIGRHIKLGEIIWKEKSVPNVNLLSFTDPEHPFINHHWLSELAFFGLDSLGGLRLIMVIKVIAILISFILIFRVLAKLKGHTLVDVLIFAFFFFIFSQRNEVRPEIFSLLFMSVYLSLLFAAKYKGEYSSLWFLPVIQLLWVNFHIYFVVGPILFGAFFVDRLMYDRKEIKRLLVIFALIILVNFANPNFISGALYPLNVFKGYGYDIAENRSPFFLEKLGSSLEITLFKLSLFIVAASWALVFRKWRFKIFELLVHAFLVFAAFKMIRNFSIYALGSALIVASNLKEFPRRLPGLTPRLKLNLLCTGVILFLIFFVASGRYYKVQESRVSFGFSVPAGAGPGVEFVKKNKIAGHVFNNFDVGSYLKWKAYHVR